MTFHLLSSTNAYLYLFKGIFNIVLKPVSGPFIISPIHAYLHIQWNDALRTPAYNGQFRLSGQKVNTFYPK